MSRLQAELLKLVAGLLGAGGVGLLVTGFLGGTGDTPFWSSFRVILLVAGGVAVGCAVYLDTRARRDGSFPGEVKSRRTKPSTFGLKAQCPPAFRRFIKEAYFRRAANRGNEEPRQSGALVFSGPWSWSRFPHSPRPWVAMRLSRIDVVTIASAAHCESGVYGVTAKSHVRQDVDDVVPPATSY
jgi:hypothetical protein